MYLVDTNVWLERLLHQAKSEEVGRFLDETPSERLFVTDFALHSVGVVLCRLRRTDGLLAFVQDAFVDGAVGLVRVEALETRRVVEVVQDFRLDFDDAYQYVAAEKNGLTLVSFDHDFDRTDRGRKTPAELLAT